MGQPLSCVPGTWTGAVTSYVYSWQVNGVPTGLPSPNPTTFAPTSSDIGTVVTCVEVAVNQTVSTLLAAPSPPAVSLPVTVPTPPGLPGSGGGSGGSGGSGSGGSGGSGGGGASGGSGGTGQQTPSGPRPNLLGLSFAPARVLIGSKTNKHLQLQLRYKLDRTAGVLIAIQRLVGNKVVTLGMVGVPRAGAGMHLVRVSAQLARKLLAVGHYRALGAAANAGGWSAPRSASLSVVRRVRKRHHSRHAH